MTLSNFSKCIVLKHKCFLFFFVLNKLHFIIDYDPILMLYMVAADEHVFSLIFQLASLAHPRSSTLIHAHPRSSTLFHAHPCWFTLIHALPRSSALTHAHPRSLMLFPPHLRLYSSRIPSRLYFFKSMSIWLKRENKIQRLLMSQNFIEGIFFMV